MNTIRETRRRAGMTQTALAARAGMLQSDISRIERGQRSITVEQLRALARALGVPPAELLGGESERAA